MFGARVAFFAPSRLLSHMCHFLIAGFLRARQLNTPVNWQKGGDVIVPPAVALADAQAKYPDLRVVKPYLRYTADPTKAQ